MLNVLVTNEPIAIEIITWLPFNFSFFSKFLKECGKRSVINQEIINPFYLLNLIDVSRTKVPLTNVAWTNVGV